MTPEQTLDTRLQSVVWRVRWLLAWHWSTRAVCAGGAVCVAWAIASRLTILDAPTAEVALAISGICALAGALAGCLIRVSEMDAARLIDARAGARERFATALELAALSEAPALAHRQLEDAAEHARTLDLRRALPLHWKGELAALVWFAIALFALLVLPKMPVFWSAAKKQEMASVQQQGKLVERVARDAETLAAKQGLPETRKAAAQVRKLARAMQRGGMDKKTAMLHMSRLTRDLAEQQKRLAAQNGPGTKSLAEAGAEVRAMLKREEALKTGKSPGDTKGAAGKQADLKGTQPNESDAMKLSQEAMRDFGKSLESQDPGGQENALRNLADQLQSGQLNPQEIVKLQSQLKKLAQALKNTPMDKKIADLLRRIGDELAKQLKKMDPAALKRWADALRKAAGQCKQCSQCHYDAKQLEALLKALKEGKLRLGGMCKNCKNPGVGLGLSAGMCLGLGKGGLHGGLGYMPNFDTGRRIKATPKAANTKVGGQHGPGLDTGPTISYTGAPDRGERVAAPYYQVYTEQKREAEGAVGRESIPSPYRDQVKRYFESVHP